MDRFCKGSGSGPTDEPLFRLFMATGGGLETVATATLGAARTLEEGAELPSPSLEDNQVVSVRPETADPVRSGGLQHQDSAGAMFLSFCHVRSLHVILADFTSKRSAHSGAAD